MDILSMLVKYCMFDVYGIFEMDMLNLLMNNSARISFRFIETDLFI